MIAPSRPTICSGIVALFDPANHEKVAIDVAQIFNQNGSVANAPAVISANTATLGAGVPENMQILVDLLNNRITPVAFARGTLGEADFPAMSYNIEAAMIGHGEVYYKGVRMKAAQALSRAGMKP